jgi:hypothetical protein
MDVDGGARRNHHDRWHRSHEIVFPSEPRSRSWRCGRRPIGSSARNCSRFPAWPRCSFRAATASSIRSWSNPAALLEYDVTLQQVEEALSRKQSQHERRLRGEGETERPIRILGRLGPDAQRVLEDLRKVPVKANELRPVLLEDVARVTEGAQFKRGDGSINGRPGVVFTWSNSRTSIRAP